MLHTATRITFEVTNITLKGISMLPLAFFALNKQTVSPVLHVQTGARLIVWQLSHGAKMQPLIIAVTVVVPAVKNTS